MASDSSQRKELTVLGLFIPLEAHSGPHAQIAPILIAVANPPLRFDYGLLSHALTVTTGSIHRTRRLCENIFHDGRQTSSGLSLVKLFDWALDHADDPPSWKSELAHWHFDFRETGRHIPRDGERHLEQAPHIQMVLRSAHSSTIVPSLPPSPTPPFPATRATFSPATSTPTTPESTCLRSISVTTGPRLSSRIHQNQTPIVISKTVCAMGLSHSTVTNAKN